MQEFQYARLNENNICIGVNTYYSELKNPTDQDILITPGQDVAWRKYENGQWSVEKYIPDHAQIELTRMEELEQAVAFILGGGLNA